MKQIALMVVIFFWSYGTMYADTLVEANDQNITGNNEYLSQEQVDALSEKLIDAIQLGSGIAHTCAGFPETKTVNDFKLCFGLANMQLALKNMGVRAWKDKKISPKAMFLYIDYKREATLRSKDLVKKIFAKSQNMYDKEMKKHSECVSKISKSRKFKNVEDFSSTVPKVCVIDPNNLIYEH